MRAMRSLVALAAVTLFGLAQAQVPAGYPADYKALADNAMAIIQALVRAKPSTAKGIYLRSITLTSTMGPGIKIDPGSVVSKSEEES